MSSAMTAPSRFLGRSYKQTYRYVRNAIEQHTHKEAFILSEKTPYQVIYRESIMQVRYYPPQDTTSFTLDDQTIAPIALRHATPILLVPPLGVFGWIYDLMAERSWVRFLNAQGFEVYLVDWGSPKKEHAGLDLDTYVNRWLSKAVDQVRGHSGAPQVSLVGYCMGGLLSLLYSGTDAQQLDDDNTLGGKVRNVVTIASPIDFHVSHWYGTLLDHLSRGAKRLPFDPTDLDHSYFHLPGDLLSRLFKLTNPFAGVVSSLDLMRNLADRQYVKAHLTTREWFTNMADYPGATVQQVCMDFGIHNRLAKGKMRIGHTLSDLTRIDANLLAFAGDNDKIVSIDAARKIMDLVASNDKTFRVVPGGHAGVFAGGKAQQHTWSLTAQWLAERSD